jgi:hypothetical protein
MCTYGRTSDLVIAPRGTPGEDAVARSTLEALRFEGGRSVFLISAVAMPALELELADRIAGKRHRKPRAVAFAEVTAFTIGEEGGQRDEAARSCVISAGRASPHAASGSPPGPRGGFTQYALDHAEFPVLLAH